jgi:hypothetical protein
MYCYAECHAECRYAECRYAECNAECRVLFTFMLSGIMLNVVMLSVVAPTLRLHLNVTGLLNEISRCEENVFCAEPMFIPRPGSARYQRHKTIFICH